MQYTLRNYTKKTFTQQELYDLQEKGVDFVDWDDDNYGFHFNSGIKTFYAVSEGSMELFLSLVEGSKKEAVEETDEFPAFVPLTEMQLKVVERVWNEWCEYCDSSTIQEYFVANQERVHNEIIEEMKQEAAEKAMKEAEEARRKVEEDKDYVTVDTGTTFEYNQQKFAFVQVGVQKYKIFLVEDGKIGWNRYFDEEFLYHQKVKISSLFKNQ